MWELFFIYCLLLIFPWISLKGAKLQFSYHSLNMAESLYLQIRNILVYRDRDITLGEYKFYTRLVQNLLFYQRELGSPVKSALEALRLGLQKDIRLERSLRKQIIGGVVQMFLISLTTWGFIMISSQVLGDESLLSRCGKVAILQFMGLVSFLILVEVLRRRKLASFPNYFFCLYQLQGLVLVGASPSKAVERAQVAKLFEGQKLPILLQRLKNTLENWRSQGAGIKGELEGILEELWHMQEDALLDLSRWLLILRSLIIMLFFLSAYFWYLIGLFGEVLMG